LGEGSTKKNKIACSVGNGVWTCLCRRELGQGRGALGSIFPVIRRGARAKDFPKHGRSLGALQAFVATWVLAGWSPPPMRLL
jgi:hypothetical protein